MAVCIKSMLQGPQQRRTLVLGKFKVHRVDVRSPSRLGYPTGFVEQIVARVIVTTLLQRGCTVLDNVGECVDNA